MSKITIRRYSTKEEFVIENERVEILFDDKLLSIPTNALIDLINDGINATPFDFVKNITK